MNLFEQGKQNTTKSGMEIPDEPIPFGMKISWFAIKADSPQTVMDRLGCTDRRVCNWSSAFEAVSNSEQVFVTPCLDGWVLVLNYDRPANYNDMERLKEIASQFEQVQYYASHRVVELNCWTKFCNGELVRGYYYIGESGEVPWDYGEITPEEKELGLTVLPKEEIEDWDDVTFPDEESVIEIAGKWSVHPFLEKYKGTKSTGFLCKMD